MAKKRSRAARHHGRQPPTRPRATVVNPFEVRVNKTKHDVLGKKSKSDRGLPGVARGKAIKKRKKTLLVEYKNRNKANEFVDRRFGEYDEQMSVEEKMLQRFALEKRKQHRNRQTFSLEEEDDDDLTHLGQSLAKAGVLGDDPEIRDDYEDDDRGEISEEAVKEAHFGGFLFKKKSGRTLDETEDHRSHKEIMEEVVLQSKKKKMERQFDKEDVSLLTEQLDANWDAVKRLLVAQEKQSKAVVALDDYDTTVKQMTFDKRASATNKRRLEERKADAMQVEREKQEAERLKRMNCPQADLKGISYSADSLDAESSARIREPRGFLEFSADDKESMESDDEGSEEENDGYEGHEEKDVEDEDEEEEDDDHDDVDDEEEDSQSEGSEMFASDLESDDENSDGLEDASSSVERATEIISESDRSVPQNVGQLSRLLQNEESAVEKMRRINILVGKIEQGAKGEKMADVLFSVLIDYMFSSSADLNLCKLLAKPLHKLSLASTGAAAYCSDRLAQIHQSHVRHSKSFPSIKSLMFLKLLGALFPASDYAHQVTTPAFIVLGEILAECSIKSTSDALLSLYTCSTVLEFVRDSKRFVPEAVRLLGRLLSKYDQVEEGESASTCTMLTLSDVDDIRNPKIRIVYTCLILIKQFYRLYCELPCVVEIFEPIKREIESVSANLKSKGNVIKNECEAVLSLLDSEKKSYRSLTLYKRKPVPIRLYEPKFDPVYEDGKKSRRSDKAKLKLKYKKELKGAVREVRKDASFLGRLRLNEQLERDAERRKKVKSLEHLLSTQQAEMKSEKRRKRKR